MRVRELGDDICKRLDPEVTMKVTVVTGRTLIFLCHVICSNNPFLFDLIRKRNRRHETKETQINYSKRGNACQS
jgi:hypothetical protein